MRRTFGVSAHRLIIGLTLLYLVGLWTAIGVELNYDHETQLRDGLTDADNLAHAYERSVDTTLRAIDTGLLMLRNEAVEHSDRFDATARTLMESTLRGSVLQIGRIDAGGRLVYVRPANQDLPIDVSDRPHVQAHLGKTGDRLYVGPVLVLRTTGQQGIPVTRPVLAADGQVIGVVTMLLSPAHLADLHTGLQIGRTGVVELVRDGDILLARGSPLKPAFDPIGQRAERVPSELSHGIRIEASPVDGVRRVMAERRLPGLPLTVRVGRGEEELLRLHDKHTRDLALAGVLLSAAVLAANAYLLRLNTRLRISRTRSAASEARLRGIIENIDVMTWELDLPSWRWTYVSPQAERMFGYPAAAWLGDPDFWSAHVHPDDRAAAQRFCTECTERSEDHDFEYRFITRDGQVVWLRDIVKVISDDRGTPIKLTGVIIDITAQVQAERALQDEKSLLQRLVDTIPDLIFFKDTSSVYLGSNTAFQRFVGRPNTDLRGRTDLELFERSQGEFFRAMDQAMLQSGKARRNEEWVTYADGRRVLLDTVKTPFVDAAGKPLGLIGVSRDITELKHQQEQLRLAQTVFDVTTEALVVTDAEGLILSVNPAFTTISGWTLPDLAGRRAADLRSEQHGAVFLDELQGRLRSHGQWDGEIWLKRRNGESFPAWLSIAVVRNADGRADKLVHAFSDITRLKRQEREIWRQANFDALTGLANRSQFMARLEQALATSRRSGRLVGLMFIDLDRFKWVNDTLGHDAGDEVLVEAARRLRDGMREVDTVARLGGDEFTIIVEGLDGAEPLAALADKVLAALARPYAVRETEQHLSGSIGITVFPTDAENASDLVRNADIAMYRAKDGGKGRHAFYSPDMQASALARVHIEHRLRQAIDDDGFVLHYQPVVDMRSGAWTGVEALLQIGRASCRERG